MALAEHLMQLATRDVKDLGTMSKECQLQAAMSNMVYTVPKKREDVAGWELDKEFNETEFAVFVKGQDMTIAFKGTDSLDDVNPDARIGLGGVGVDDIFLTTFCGPLGWIVTGVKKATDASAPPPEIRGDRNGRAHFFYPFIMSKREKLRLKGKVNFTGHSLGGYRAFWTAAYHKHQSNGIPFAGNIFNPGSSHLDNRDRDPYVGEITAHIIVGDPISEAWPKSRTPMVWYRGWVRGLFGEHKLQNFLIKVAENGGALQPATYNISIAGGTDPGKNHLSCTHSGKVDLYSRDDGSGRQRWQLFPTQLRNGKPAYNIHIVGGTVGNMLSCRRDGYVDLFDLDDDSGRQKWILVPLGNDQFIIQVAGGTDSGKSVLSCTPDGHVDLWSRDDGSGRQRWVIKVAQ